MSESTAKDLEHLGVRMKLPNEFQRPGEKRTGRCIRGHSCRTYLYLHPRPERRRPTPQRVHRHFRPRLSHLGMFSNSPDRHPLRRGRLHHLCLLVHRFHFFRQSSRHPRPSRDRHLRRYSALRCSAIYRRPVSWCDCCHASLQMACPSARRSLAGPGLSRRIIRAERRNSSRFEHRPV
jgi:hypothetical protein